MVFLMTVLRTVAALGIHGSAEANADHMPNGSSTHLKFSAKKEKVHVLIVALIFLYAYE